jgi:hypothetical protein
MILPCAKPKGPRSGHRISALFVENLLVVEPNAHGAALRKMKIDLREVGLEQKILE